MPSLASSTCMCWPTEICTHPTTLGKPSGAASLRKDNHSTLKITQCKAQLSVEPLVKLWLTLQFDPSEGGGVGLMLGNEEVSIIGDWQSRSGGLADPLLPLTNKPGNSSR